MGTMRWFPILGLIAMMPAFSQSSDERDALAATQKMFDAMAAHDASAIRSVSLPDARLFAIGEQDVPPPAMAMEDFATRIAAIHEQIQERFTGQPSISIHGRMAQVWGEYEFLREGKFHHCGVDSFSLLKTAQGWKIAAIVYTSEITGCGKH